MSRAQHFVQEYISIQQRPRSTHVSVSLSPWRRFGSLAIRWDVQADLSLCWVSCYPVGSAVPWHSYSLKQSQFWYVIQSTHFISTPLISNSRLSWSEILVPVLTWKSNTDKKYCGKEEKLLLRSNFSFSTIFSICLWLQELNYIHVFIC